MALDDPQLLELMLKDLSNAPAAYKPTRYWQRYVEHISHELRVRGLHDFRRRYGSYLASFGATDPGPRYRVLLDNRRVNNMRTQRIPGFTRVLGMLDSFFTDFVGDRVLHAARIYGYTTEDAERQAIEKATAFGARGSARPPTDLDASLVGNPDHVFRIGERPMTMSVLDYYMRYAYCSRFIDFREVATIAELGTGSGKQVEVTVKLHPQVTYLCFDLPPQLYVAEQYLKEVFPGRVVSYASLRNFDGLPSLDAGKIYMFANWQFPFIADSKLDVFWNAASFQEMEPGVVQNYLRPVNAVARWVFLKENMRGMHRASESSDAGVIEPTLFEHYERFLSAFRNVDVSPTEYAATTSTEFSDSFWVRRDG